MKKILLSFASAILLFGSAQAQDGIEIKVDGIGSDVSGTVVEKTLAGLSPYEVKFYVTNNTGSDQQWRITRVIQEQPPADWSDQLCWPPLCYQTNGAQSYITPHNPPNSPAPIVQDGGYTTTLGQEAIIKPVILYTNPVGSAKYMYYITDLNGNYVDSVGLLINPNVGIEENTPNLSVSVSPNPASESINVSAQGVQEAEVRMVDVLGNVVLNESLVGAKKIDVTKFRNGIYFVIVKAEGAEPVTRKVIVRH